MDDKYKDVGDPYTHVEEECAELIKAICKTRRFGLYNWNPKDPDKTTNKELILREMTDVKIRISELEIELQKV